MLTFFTVSEVNANRVSVTNANRVILKDFIIFVFKLYNKVLNLISKTVV
ncbi:hypothetical protein FORMA_06200 [Formosa sp. Hel3_A1_48]|nr:hypothetical protein FORMA_06200 [Formosa sp. Hel3_A1_48]